MTSTTTSRTYLLAGLTGARSLFRPGLAMLGSVLLISAWLFWIAALLRTNLGEMGELGLIAVLPWQFYLGPLLLAVGFSILLVRNAPSFLLGGYLVGAVFMVHATPAILYQTLRYAWTWKHLGIIDYIQRHGMVDRYVPYLDAYHNWPGMFAWGAFLELAAGLPDLYAIANWAPVYFNLLNLAALAILLRTFTDDRRLFWLSLWFYVLSSWVAQDYFSPQALAFFLYLVVLGICLTWFPRNTMPRFMSAEGFVAKWTRSRFRLGLVASQWSGTDSLGQPLHRSLPAPALVGLLAIVFLLFVGMVWTHQLTPVLAVFALGALVVFGRLSTRTLPVMLGVITLTWVTFAAAPFATDRFGAVLGDLGRIWANFRLGTAGEGESTREQLILTFSSLGLTLLVFTSASMRDL